MIHDYSLCCQTTPVTFFLEHSVGLHWSHAVSAGHLDHGLIADDFEDADILVSAYHYRESMTRSDVSDCAASI